MRKLIVVALGLAFIATFWIGTASADTTRPLEYSNVDQSVMGPRTSGEAFRTQMQIGASARQHTAGQDYSHHGWHHWLGVVRRPGLRAGRQSCIAGRPRPRSSG